MRCAPLSQLVLFDYISKGSSVNSNLKRPLLVDLGLLLVSSKNPQHILVEARLEVRLVGCETAAAASSAVAGNEKTHTEGFVRSSPGPRRLSSPCVDLPRQAKDVLGPMSFVIL